MNYWGRIFFDDPVNPKTVKAQPLKNHVGNCHIILNGFHESYFHVDTKERLMKAVLRHDEGKKSTFRLRQFSNEINRKDSKKLSQDNMKIQYSFAGHRFKVVERDPYIDGLIRSHHEFSVEQINREISRLSGIERKTFADDLYLLCMADQIEAELAVKSVENINDVPRTFMEFITQRIGSDFNEFSVVPWPFSQPELPLDFHLKVLRLSGRKRFDCKDIEKLLKNDQTQFTDETVSIVLRRD